MTTIHFPEEKELETIDSYSSWETVVCQSKPFGEVTAEEYFEFAKNARERSDKSGLVDALSNAKRCFHYQIDRLLYEYGLREVASDLDFPPKLELLSELQIIPGTLLRIFNKERNAMEHDYTAPSQEIVDGAIDLCELLFLATERYLTRTPPRIRIKFKNDNRDLIALLELGSNKIQFFEILGTELIEDKFGKYFTPAIFDLGNHEKTRDGITIKKLDEDMPISFDNKNKWITILRLFSKSARNENDSPVKQDESRVVIANTISWDEFKSAIDKMKNAH